MVEASVKSVDMSGAVAKIGRLKSNNGLGLYAAQQAGSLMDKYVPKLNSILANYKAEPWKVVYTVPYARRQFYGDFDHSQSNNPMAIKEWSRPLEDNPADLAKRLQAYVSR